MPEQIKTLRSNFPGINHEEFTKETYLKISSIKFLFRSIKYVLSFDKPEMCFWSGKIDVENEPIKVGHWV